jgi:phage terminase large subunit GpA-like protein
VLDEVQGMESADIDKVRARMGDSDMQFTMMLSTPNHTGTDINEWYLRGHQAVWHTRCPHCEALSDLSDPAGIFPGPLDSLQCRSDRWCAGR